MTKTPENVTRSPKHLGVFNLTKVDFFPQHKHQHQFINTTPHPAPCPWILYVYPTHIIAKAHPRQNIDLEYTPPPSWCLYKLIFFLFLSTHISPPFTPPITNHPPNNISQSSLHLQHMTIPTTNIAHASQHLGVSNLCPHFSQMSTQSPCHRRLTNPYTLSKVFPTAVPCSLFVNSLFIFVFIAVPNMSNIVLVREKNEQTTRLQKFHYYRSTININSKINKITTKQP